MHSWRCRRLLFIADGISPTVEELRLTGGDGAYGGGLFLGWSAATLSSNTVSDNTASAGGGGLYLWESDATLSDNMVYSNTAGSGGGLFL